MGRPSRISRTTWCVAAILALGAGLGVALWVLSDTGVIRFYYVPDWASSGLALWLLIVASAIANSAYEEVLWRFLLPQVLGGQAVLLSIGFGLAHINSLPSGLSGVLLTTVFALAAHWIVSRSGGSILTTIGAHFVADVVLLSMILT